MVRKRSENLKTYFEKFDRTINLSVAAKLPVLGMIRFYQIMISPILGGNCRFYPSCSKYAYDAVSAHGPVKGLFLALVRLLKCHPYNPGGFDPVPEKFELWNYKSNP